MPSPLKHLLHDIKYTTLDELHENDPGLTIDVVPGGVRHGLVSIKLHAWHLLSSHLEHTCNVVVVLLTLLWIKMRLRLRGCLYAIIGGVLTSFPVDGFSAKYLHAFFVLVKLLDENHEYWECYLCQFYGYISTSYCGLYGRPL